jgi:membrane protease YdiL (CAAX protease family)
MADRPGSFLRSLWRAPLVAARAAFSERGVPSRPEATGRDLLAIVLAFVVLAIVFVATLVGLEHSIALFDPEFYLDVYSAEVIFGAMLGQTAMLFASVWWRMRSRWATLEDWGFGAFSWSFAAIGIGIGVVLSLVGDLFADTTFDVDVRGNLQYAALLFIFAVIAAPIIEEIIFRRALFGWLRHRFGVGAAIVVSSLVFGILHFLDGWGSVAAAGIMGFAFASIVQVQRTLWIGVFAHATNNAIWVLALFLGWQ